MSNEPPGRIEIRAWARLIRVSQRLLQDVESDLKRASLPPLAWYDALLELRRAGDQGLRPQALQKEMLLEQYNLSRLLDRLEKAGLVERERCSEDRRGQVVRLTQPGSDLLARMWPVYRKSIEAHFASRLEPGQADEMIQLVDRFI